MNERRIHQVFEVSLLLKGAHAVIECIGGIALALIPPGSLAAMVHAWVNAWTQDELSEDPKNFVATHLVAWSQHLSVASQHFYAFYLLSHGVVKVLLVIGLLRGRLWSYPASLVAMTAFIAYQLYRFSYTHGPFLIALTVFDLMVIALVWHEWQVVRRHPPRRGLKAR